jgi:hypothetical protein
VVSVLAIKPKVHRFKPGQGRLIFHGNKICSTTNFEGKVKLSATSYKILWHVTDPCSRLNSWTFLAKVLPASLLGVHWLLPELWLVNQE